MPQENMAIPLRAKIAKLLSPLVRVRGMYKVLSKLAGQRGTFIRDDGKAVFAGDLASFIDRQVFLLGAYEADFIELFLSRIERGGVALDVGANVGNHSLRFACHFDSVLAFEPNPIVLPALRRNISLNPSLQIDLHPFGLSDTLAELDFYNIDNGNLGLGTFSPAEQYDQPLIKVGSAQVERGDDIVGDRSVRAIKVDVQGFEPQVLRGLQRVLQRDRPVAWVEFGDATLSNASTRRHVEALFPYPIVLERFVSNGIGRKATLERIDEEHLSPNDYLVSPAS